MLPYAVGKFVAGGICEIPKEFIEAHNKAAAVIIVEQKK